MPPPRPRDDACVEGCAGCSRWSGLTTRVLMREDDIVGVTEQSTRPTHSRVCGCRACGQPSEARQMRTVSPQSLRNYEVTEGFVCLQGTVTHLTQVLFFPGTSQKLESSVLPHRSRFLQRLWVLLGHLAAAAPPHPGPGGRRRALRPVRLGLSRSVSVSVSVSCGQGLPAA